MSMVEGANSSLRAKGVKWPRMVTISVDGEAITARDGEMLAPALLAAGFRALGTRLRDGRPIGIFCLMGSCQECRVLIDGRLVLSCQQRVSDGMSVSLRGKS